MTEAQAQATIFEWASLMERSMPELALLFHIPNGGKRDARTAAILKRSGVKKGVPDLCLPIPRNGYHGLWIELKVGQNKPTFDQKRWLNELNRQGYLAKVCVGYSEAIQLIANYLKGAMINEID